MAGGFDYGPSRADLSTMTPHSRQDEAPRRRKPTWSAKLPAGLRLTRTEIDAKRFEAGLRKYEAKHGCARLACGTCHQQRDATSFLRHEEGGFILRNCASCRGEHEPPRRAPARRRPPQPSVELHFHVDTLLLFLRHDSMRDERLDHARKIERDTGGLPTRLLLVVDAVLCEFDRRGRVPRGTQQAIRADRRSPKQSSTS